MPTPQLRRAVIKTFSMKVAGEGLFTAYQIFAARALDAHANGALLTAINLLYLWGAVGLLGFPGVIARFAAIYRHENDAARLRGLLRAGWLVAGLVWLVAVAITMVADSVGVGLMQGLRLGPPLLLAALLLWGLMLMHRDFIRSLGLTFSADLGFQLIRPALPLLLGLLALAAHAYSLHAALLHLLAALAAVLLIDLFVMRRALHGLGGPASHDWRIWFKEARSLSAVAILRTILERADIPLVALIAGVEAAAIYGVASRLAALPGLFLDPLRSALRPAMAVAHRIDDRESMRSIARFGGTWMTLAGLPILLVLCVFTAPLLRLFGPGYAAGAGVVLALSVGKFSGNLFGLSGAVLNMSGHNRAQAWAYVVTVGATGLALCIAATGGGAQAAALVVAIGWVALNLALLVLVRLRLGFWAVARFDRRSLLRLARFVAGRPAGQRSAAESLPP